MRQPLFSYAIKAHFRLARPKNLSKFQARLQLASVGPMTGLFNLVGNLKYN